jgi:peptidoglycan-associated lipoprotein
MRLKDYFRTIMLGSSIVVLTSCAAWHSNQQDASSIIDGNSSLASNAQPTGLGEDSAVQENTTMASDQDLTKRTYYFDYDKSAVRDEDKPAIEANAQYLLNHPNAKALVEGHTDPRGSREYNIALGERRSKAIQELLKEQGVKSSQIRIISYGAEKLASNGHADSDYQLDRRGVLVYLQQ